MILSAKQDSIGEAISRGVKVIVLEGAMGTSKTYGAAVALLTIAVKFPGSIIFVGRMTMPEMKTGTLLSFREAAQDMGLREGYHYKDNKADHYFQFMREGRGSFIFFREMNHIKDPQFFKLKSANLTCGLIDEADGVVENGFNMLNSRTGRANKNGAPDFVILACNANEGWIKEKYYNKYHEPEKYGYLPADTEVIEFELEDSFLPDSYYLKQMGNPKQWVERYLRNNWNFGDDLYSLFKYRYMDGAHTVEFAASAKTLGIDAGRVQDRTVGGCWTGNVLTDIVIFKDKNVEMDYDEQAELVHEYCIREGIGYQNIWVDAVGEGQGLITALKSKYGWVVNSYISQSVPESKLQLELELSKATDDYQRRQIKKRYPVVYADLRSEQGYKLSLGFEQGNVKLFEGCPLLGEFKKEATMHNHTDNGKVFRLEPKDKVKERLQLSPDIFDCVLMGFYGQTKAQAIGTYASRRATVNTSTRRPKVRREYGGLRRGQKF
jgi:hypothetical protein